MDFLNCLQIYAQCLITIGFKFRGGPGQIQMLQNNREKRFVLNKHSRLPSSAITTILQKHVTCLLIALLLSFKAAIIKVTTIAFSYFMNFQAATIECFSEFSMTSRGLIDFKNYITVEMLKAEILLQLQCLISVTLFACHAEERKHVAIALKKWLYFVMRFTQC